MGADAWGQRKLGEVSYSLVRGPFGGSLKKEIFVSQGYRVYEQQDAIYGAEVNGRYYITQDKYDEMSRFAIADGDFIISCSGTIGKIHRLPQNSPSGVINQALLKITVDESKILPDFFLQYFRWDKFQHSIIDDTQGGAIKNLIGMDSFKKTEINCPAIAEQTAIGDFFRTLDDAITLHQRKLDYLRELKRGYLQQMFLQAGERVPRVRFSGFVGEWINKKAGEVFISVSDKNHPHLPVLSASQEKGMVLRDEIGIDIKYNENALGTYKRIMPEQFAIHLRSFQGGFAHSTLEGITSPAYTILNFENKGEHDSTFWKEIFTSSSFIKRLETITYGIRDGRSISFDEFSTLIMHCPTVVEQTVIGNFFRIFDEQITAQATKLKQLKQLKAAYLQQMFV